MSEAKSNDTKYVGLRMPLNLYEEVMRLAEKDCRDTSKQIFFMLKRYLEAQEAGK